MNENLSWTNFKALKDLLKFNIVYIEDDASYRLIGVGVQGFVPQCFLPKIAGSDLTDFEDNYQDSANATISEETHGIVIKSVPFSLAVTGSVVSAVENKRIKVFAYKLICSSALSVKFRSGANTDIEGAQPFGINGGVVEDVNPPAFLFGTLAGESLDLVITGVGTASGRISYWDGDGK